MNLSRCFLGLSVCLVPVGTDFVYGQIPNIAILRRRSHKNDNPLDVQSFPKQVNKEKKINEYDIEAVPQNSFSPKLRLFGKKTSLCSRHKGSYTLEAAVIIPILAFFFVTILFFFRVLQVQTQVQTQVQLKKKIIYIVYQMVLELETVMKNFHLISVLLKISLTWMGPALLLRM